MISKPFVAATSALALLAMTGAVHAGPPSSSHSAGANYMQRSTRAPMRMVGLCRESAESGQRYPDLSSVSQKVSR
jgi:hypothetical protein